MIKNMLAFAFLLAFVAGLSAQTFKVTYEYDSSTQEPYAKTKVHFWNQTENKLINTLDLSTLQLYRPFTTEKEGYSSNGNVAVYKLKDHTLSKIIPERVLRKLQIWQYKDLMVPSIEVGLRIYLEGSYLFIKDYLCAYVSYDFSMAEYSKLWIYREDGTLYQVVEPSDVNIYMAKLSEDGRYLAHQYQLTSTGTYTSASGVRVIDFQNSSRYYDIYSDTFDFKMIYPGNIMCVSDKVYGKDLIGFKKLRILDLDDGLIFELSIPANLRIQKVDKEKIYYFDGISDDYRKGNRGRKMSWKEWTFGKE